MTRALAFAAAVLLAAGGASAAVVVPHGVVAVDLPPDRAFAFKPGDGLVSAQTYCLTCHSAAYVTTQPVLTRAQWQAEVAKMRAVYAAKIPDEAVPVIAAYLAQAYGKP